MERVQGSFQGAPYTSRYHGPKAQRVSGTHSGNMIVLQYAQAFNDLCQYAGYHADTDEKKRDRSRRGLSTKLRDRLNTVRANNYNELVSMAISQEDCITARQAEKKRKSPVAGPSAQPQRFRIVSDTQNRGPQQQKGRWVIRPQQ
jgi:predicted PolB exonuclease-like 3'-5' exonuclease